MERGGMPRGTGAEGLKDGGGVAGAVALALVRTPSS